MPCLFPMLTDTGGQRGDVVGMIMVVTHEAQFRQVRTRLERARQAIEHRGSRGPRELRIERQHQDAICPTTGQLAPHLFHGRLAVGHRKLYRNLLAQRFGQTRLQRGTLTLADGHQRRAVFRPHRGIGLGDLLGASRQHQAMQDRQPEQTRQVDHAYITEKLREVATHRLGCRGFRGAEIDQHDAETRGAHGR